MGKIHGKCLAALYGHGEAPTVEEVEAELRDKAARIGQSEYNHQRMLHVWLKRNHILHFHCPNELVRNEEEGRKQALIGLSPGVPDIIIPMARKPHHGLAIELKREIGGVISGAQEWWLRSLTEQGYLAVVSTSFTESQRIVMDYMQGEKWE